MSKAVASLNSGHYLTNEEVRDFIENASLSLHCVGPDGIIVWANETELNTLGYSEDEYIGKHIAGFHADPEIINDILDRLGRNETLTNYESQMVCKDGNIKDVLINSNVSIKNGKFLHTRCFTKDISDFKAMQRVFEEKNKELEQFLFVASHDLQEPLRTLRSFTQILSDELGDDSRKDVEEELSFISKATDRMHSLITALSEYARISDRKNCSEICLNECVEEAILNLKEKIVSSGAEIKFSNLPTINANLSLITILFEHLISNAIKYNSNKPEINIECKKHGNSYLFQIKDNGIGINKKYLEKIFQPFQRLHAKHEYEGVGIGLAICKKIVTMYKGKIWVESSPGHGSIFKFLI